MRVLERAFRAIDKIFPDFQELGREPIISPFSYTEEPTMNYWGQNCDCPPGINCECEIKEYKMSKEKTREIKVWVQKEILTDKESRSRNIRPMVCPVQGEVELCTDYFVEGTLLIKEPEKTVTISESQFVQMARDIEYDSRLTAISSNHISARTKWFKQLFGSET